MKRLPCASNGGAVDPVVAYCLVAPYFMVAHGYGECCCFFHLVAELFQCFFGVEWHGLVDLSLFVVPIEGDAYVLISGQSHVSL